MDINEEIDEAEELRYLALRSMVRRSKPAKYIKTEETDDSDILLLRAAALKTITTKNTQIKLLVNKDDKPKQSTEINKKKRNSRTSVLKSNKMIKLENNLKNRFVNSSTNNPSIKKDVLKHNNTNHKCNNLIKLQPKIESKPFIESKDDVKKIVKNGCIQLSNLDSKNVNETMVLRITFSSSESDDSSNECDTKYVLQKKNEVCNNVKNNTKHPPTPKQHNHLEFAEFKSFEDNNELKMINYMKTLAGLMKHCESEIEKRNQQMVILLDAYEKYKNYNQSLCSILKTMTKVREELSNCNLQQTDNETVEVKDPNK